MWKSFLAVGCVLVPVWFEPPRSGPEGLEQAIRRIAGEALEAGVPGLSVAVAFGDELVLGDGWGYVEGAEVATERSVMPVGALGEAFLACVVLQLVEEDELALDDTLTSLVPALVRAPDEAAAKDEDAEDEPGDGRLTALASAAPAARRPRLEEVTLAQLLTHTSGLPSYEDWLAERRAERIEPGPVLGWLADMPLEFEPGSCAQYSDTNPWLLGLIAENATGLAVPELLRTRVFAPAGMTDTTYCSEGRTLHEFAYDVHEFAGTEITHAKRPRPFDSDRLCSTPGDLLRWMRALVDRELVGEAGFRALTTPPAVEHGGPGGRGHGLDVTQLDGEPCFSTGGGSVGYRAHVAWYPGLDLTICVLAAGDETRVRALERSIARAAFGLPEPGVHDLPLERDDARPYLGDYMVGCNLYRVTFTNGSLVVHTPEGRALPMAYQGRHAFLARNDHSISMTFHVDEGAAHSFTLVEQGVESFGRRMG